MLAGHATAEGTAAYRTRVGAAAVAAHFREWKGLALSSVGLGTYLGDDDEATDRAYEQALARALALGLNVVDSAVNYRGQRSERAIGSALRSLTAAGQVARPEVFLATKGGFIPGDSGAADRGHPAQAYVRAGLATAGDIVAGCHCMAPRYLADQLERSRANLGVETIDVYYLHNPETQLQEIDRRTFVARIRAAFELLENAVAAKRVRWYGAATWTGFRGEPTARDYLSLAELTEAATAVGGKDHHFRVIQLPYNLGMTEAFTTRNQRVGREQVSVLEAARRLDVYVMTSASIYQGRLARGLPPVIAEFLPGLDTDAQRALQFVRSTPGVGTALVGMAHVSHVEENARVRGVAPLRWPEFQRLFQGEESA